jgi:stage II sporulation protein D
VWSKSKLDAKLGSFVKGRLKSVKVTKRGVSPRIVDAQVIGTRGTVDVTGPQLRSRLGLYDTWAYFVTIKSGQGDASPQPQEQPTNDMQVTDGGGVTASSAWWRRVAEPGARTLYVTGAVSPVTKRITLQQLADRTWKTVGYGTADARGRYALLVESTGTYRVLANGGVGPAVHVR